MKSPKVLLICYGIPFGGAEVYSGRLARLLEDKAQFYALCCNERLASYLTASGVTVIRPFLTQTDGAWWKLRYLIACALMLPYLRIKYRLNCLWIQGFREAWLLPWARLCRYNLFVTMHITLGRSLSQLCYPYLVLFAHKVVCVSRPVEKSLPSTVSRAKVEVILNWMVAQTPSSRGYSDSDDHLHLLYVGRLIQYKGASLILEAMHELNAKGLGGKVSLTIVGDGSYRQCLEQQAEGLNVQFLGFVTDPTQAYQNADVFISPTYGPEGLPLTSLEAMSHGLACVLSDLDVNRELADDGKCALLFRRGDAADLCAKLELCLQSRAMLARLGAMAVNAIDTRYSAEAAHAQYGRALLE
jgi:glycosyltransferase involved in cell wall biosynthesis